MRHENNTSRLPDRPYFRGFPTAKSKGRKFVGTNRTLKMRKKIMIKEKGEKDIFRPSFPNFFFGLETINATIFSVQWI